MFLVLNSYLDCPSSSSLPPTDRRRLSELNLPKENFLHLTTPAQFDAGGENDSAEKNGENE